MSKNVFTFDIVMTIQELSRTKAKEIKGLTSKKNRDSEGLFIAEGEKCVIDLLKGFTPDCLIATSQWIKKNSWIPEKYEKTLYQSDIRGIEMISSLNSLPEVIGVFQKREEQKVQISSDRLYLMLDEIQDPGNLGTIIRTCDWFGIYDVFASRNTADAYGPKVVQATMGSLTRVKVHYVNLEEIIDQHPEITVMGALLNGIPIEEFGRRCSGFLLMGNEGKGISEKLRTKINEAITIPPVNKTHHPDSLNVAIATAIILSQIK